MKNKDLKKIYDSQKLDFHSGFNESMMIVNMMDSWQGLDVLEIGCGHGHLASILSYAGAAIVGVDYSEEQRKIARATYPNVDFRDTAFPNGTFHLYPPGGGTLMSKFDVVVMQGVLEHLDDPWWELEKIMADLLKPRGVCCLSVPHWVNPRGYIYHALRLLFDAKMSLTDLHYFLPRDFAGWCKSRPIKRKGTIYNCQFYDCDKSWAAGEEMIADLRERLPKALLETGRIDMGDIDKFLKFLEKMLPDIPAGPGACLGVKISK